MIYDPNVISREYVDEELKRYLIPGMGVTVMKDDRCILSSGFGCKDTDTGEPITGSTKWGIASCSKAFTSALIAILVDKGLIEYDIPIIEYLPDFRMYNDILTRECTIRDMLMHRTGLSEHDAVWADKTTDRGELYRRLRYLKPRAPFRTEMIYNNTVYTVIGAIAEKISGMSWEDMIREWIFRPLGMRDSYPTLAEISGCSDKASPYWNYNGTVKKIGLWDISPGDPCGGIVSCMDDAIKWVQFNLHNGKVGDTQIISEKNMREMHRMQISTPFWAWPIDELHTDGGYGLGWFTYEYKGHDVVLHLGEIEGYCTLFAFMPDDGLSYVSFVNLHKPCVLPLFSVLFTVIDNVLKLGDSDWSGSFAEHIYDYGELHQHWNVDMLEDAVPVKSTSPSHRPEEYAGIYHNDGYGRFEIICDNSELSGIYRGMRQTLEHLHYDTFRVPDIKEDTILVTAPLTFYADACTGRISGFGIGIDPSGDTVIFKKEEQAND